MRNRRSGSGWAATKVAALLVLWLAGAASCQETVVIRVRVMPPADTPPGDTLYLAGALPALGSWRPDGRVLTREQQGAWTTAIHVARHSSVEFKVTRGTWEREAIYTPGIIPPNVIVAASSDTTVDVRPVTWRDLMPRPAGGISGNSVSIRGLTGEGLRYARGITVWLPPSYGSDTTHRFSVLYMHDGQNVFDPSTSSFGAEWRADEVADSLIRAGAIAEVIIVGVDNTADRIAEYSDTPLGRAYVEFLIHRVIPLVDSTFRTRTGPEHTAIMGSSMGGLISFLAAWWHPEVFGGAGCLSSVFTRGRTGVLDEVERSGPRSRAIRVYMDCGGAGGDETLKPGMEEMTQLLAERGYTRGRDVEVFFDPAARHDERAWASRLWRPLTFLFGIAH